MPSHGHTFDQFLLGSVTAKVLHGTECPIWTSAHVEESPAQEFAIRNVLCAVNFDSHDRKLCRGPRKWPPNLAPVSRSLTSLPAWSFGGRVAATSIQEWKEALVSDASQHIAELQQDMGIKADVFIGSGNVPKVLSQAVKQTKADLLVTGCYPYGGHLRTHGYAIICAVPIPVLSV